MVPSFAETYEALEKVKAFFYAQSASDADRENILSLEKSYFQLRQKSGFCACAITFRTCCTPCLTVNANANSTREHRSSSSAVPVETLLALRQWMAVLVASLPRFSSDSLIVTLIHDLTG